MAHAYIRVEKRKNIRRSYKADSMDSRYGGHDYSELIYRTVFLFYDPNLISVRDWSCLEVLVWPLQHCKSKFLIVLALNLSLLFLMGKISTPLAFNTAILIWANIVQISWVELRTHKLKCILDSGIFGSKWARTISQGAKTRLSAWLG